MNLKFLKTINEATDADMGSDEINSYLNILYKKCNRVTQAEFNDYLKEQCDVDDVDLKKCSEIMCDSDTDLKTIVNHLEDISNKIDENSLPVIMKLKETFNGQVKAADMKGAEEIVRFKDVIFYEHPTYGDEYPLVGKHKGKYYSSGFYDIPSREEVQDFFRMVAEYDAVENGEYEHS